MALPSPPRDFTTPIPNGPFFFAEKYYLKTKQGEILVNESLEIDPVTGSISVAP